MSPACPLWLVGVTVTVGAATPMPEIESEPDSFPSRLSIPANVPTVVGAKVISMLQELEGGSDVEQLFVSVKLGSPEIEMLLIVNATLPVEIIWTWPTMEVPTVNGLKLKGVEGLKTNAGSSGATADVFAITNWLALPCKIKGG